MAEKSKKREKQVSTSSNQPVPANNQLAVPPVDLVNRYQVLGQIPKTGYNSTLAYPPISQNYTTVNQHAISNPYFSAQPIQASQPYPTNLLPKNPSSYIPKSQSSNLFYIEPALSNIHNPTELAKAYFPPKWHFIPHHPEKSITFYTDILLQTQSVVLRNIPDKNNPDVTIYHHLYIHNIITLNEWGHPSSLKILSNHSVPYNYYDYIEAWFKILLHENERFTHSWFIQFDQKFKSILPTWFLRWWSQNGAVPEIIPCDLMDQVTYFSSQKKFDKHLSQFPTLLHFIAKYKVPWILKWKYCIIDNVVIRQFLVKWWDKFIHQRIIDQVKIEFPVNVPTLYPQTQQSKIALSQIQSSLSAVSTVKLGSPTASSSSKSKAKSRPSNSELLKMAQQLLAQASQQQEDESSDDSATATSQIDPFSSLFQDAQDPYA